MHDEAMDFCKSVANPSLTGKGLDIGGANYNGTARILWPKVRWDVVDKTDPDGYVNIVGDFLEIRFPLGYDIILCTEVLEHSDRWQTIVRKAYDLLNPGGQLVITCAGPGREPHSSSGDILKASEYYSNITPIVLHNSSGGILKAPEYYNNITPIVLQNLLKSVHFMHLKILRWQVTSDQTDIYVWAMLSYFQEG